MEEITIMIKVFCHTNLDDYKAERWPDYFCCRPLLGDIVKGASEKSLRIVRIVHRKINDIPSLEIELHK